MNFDTWFNKQNRLIQIILLVIPFVNWICEILVRASALIRKTSVLNIVGLVVFIFGGWVFAFIDLIIVILTGKMFIIE